MPLPGSRHASPFAPADVEPLWAAAQREGAVAQLALAAIAEPDLDKLANEAVQLVAAHLAVDRVHVLEFQPDGTPRLRASIGSPAGLPERAADVLAGAGSDLSAPIRGR